VIRRLVPLLLAAAVLTGCGEERGGQGEATLWVTRDRGAHVLVETTVPAGLTAMQALDRAADIDTRYGGRFVQSVNGIEGSRAGQRDWFWFVNGIEGDRSAVEYRLRAGDVEWWDYRSWHAQMEQPVVVGAFPEPFLHGYDGHVRPAVVVGVGPAAQTLARLTHARLNGPTHGANVLEIVGGRALFRGARIGDGSVRFVIGARDARRLAANPRLARFRYEGLP
jgi:Domain of unknown function (DUF4430)